MDLPAASGNLQPDVDQSEIGVEKILLITQFTFMSSKIIFHLPRHLFERFSLDEHDFTANMFRTFKEHGVECELAIRVKGALASDYAAKDFHFIHQGHVSGPNILNTSLAYLGPFWYADPKGVMSFSSLKDKKFNPSTLPKHRVEAFHDRLVGQLKSQRRSKYGQPDQVLSLPLGCISVFLQGVSGPVEAAKHMSEKDMLLEVFKHRAGRPVVIKHHPRNVDPETFDWLKSVSKSDPDIRVVDAHVHDMIAACDFTVSMCSGASFESLLLEKPTVVFGQADFHHCAETVSRSDQVGPAFERAISRDYRFKEYIFWHWNRHCINLRQKGRLDKVVERMAANGYDVGQLGLEKPK